jgi:hypothetical protein
MGISKKYIREAFKSKEMQLTREALLMLEDRLKLFTDCYAAMCKHREFKRVNKIRLDRIFKYEDSFEKG